MSKQEGREEGECAVEVYDNEADEKRVGIVCKDTHGNETVRVGFPLDVAKDVAYQILNKVYRLEHGLPLPGDEQQYPDEEEDDEGTED